ncbi:MAG: YihA family ribosome biogenesis GTP-binding protein [Saprospiraceae bacterium]|nr:YihA family ribosome biogenesis GTP-binding protein [Saprospiraceae bacterium]
MDVHHTEFRGSFPKVNGCPKDDRPEFAFIGRSNVGKSSLINMLSGKKDLAHTSKKPGKTQLINYFLINHQWHLVDLPGYGYAKISKTKRKEWEKMIQDYLVKRLQMQCAFVLVDSMIPPQNIDIEFMNWLGEMHIPFVIVYTKTDRLKPAQLEENLTEIRAELSKYWEPLPQQFLTSSEKGIGRKEILSFIEEVRVRAEE